VTCSLSKDITKSAQLQTANIVVKRFGENANATVLVMKAYGGMKV
jgi:hypothetical protein